MKIYALTQSIYIYIAKKKQIKFHPYFLPSIQKKKNFIKIYFFKSCSYVPKQTYFQLFILLFSWNMYEHINIIVTEYIARKTIIQTNKDNLIIAYYFFDKIFSVTI